MEYRKLGQSGLKLSELSFGSWVTFNKQVDSGLAERMFGTCFDAGINFFDNAEGYEAGQSEIVMGKALTALARPRDSYCVSSKVFFGSTVDPMPTQIGLSKKHITEACHQALKRLQVDYLDLYFCHRADPDTPIGETVWAMHNLITQGKILYWGTSEWEAADVVTAIEIAERHHLHKPVVEQPVYNLFQRHRFAAEYDRLYKELGYGSTTWSPLASGLLTGKYQAGIPSDSRGALEGYDWLQGQLTDADSLAKVAALQPIAREMGASLAQFSLAWCLQNPHVSSVMTGASRVEQLHENMKAIEFIDSFTPDVMAAIDRICQ